MWVGRLCIYLPYVLDYKPSLSVRQMVFYLRKAGIVPDSIIRQALPRSMHWLFHSYSGKADMTNTNGHMGINQCLLLGKVSNLISVKK